MPTSIRSRNLDLIRWLNGGHENTANKLASLTNGSYISKMAIGDMEIDDHTARRIESLVNLPVGWLDRDNIARLNRSQVEAQIAELVFRLPAEKQAALVTILAP